MFERYNLAVWPAQLFLNALGILAICLALQRKSGFSKGVSLTLSMFWIWTGLVYHFLFFSIINSAALLFALLFVVQGVLFFVAGVWKQQLKFRLRLNLNGFVGGACLLYALIVYPALGHWLGHRFPASPTFGLPCPTTIFTFGMLLWTDRRVPLYLLVIPLVWSFLGFWAAISLRMTEDYGLLAAEMLGSLLIIWRNNSFIRPMPNSSQQVSLPVQR